MKKPQKNQSIADFNNLKETAQLISNTLNGIGEYISESFFDSICGSWIAEDGQINLLIRKSSKGFQAVVCNTSKNYKVVEKTLGIEFRKNKLVLTHAAGVPTGEYAEYDQAKDILYFGHMGAFVPECTQLIEEYHLQSIAGQDQELDLPFN
ncbi:MAG: DUF3876 domain-containing protein [Alistipes sp.]|nr:DUF3876 domain-containing protein [Alistipes sp.]